MTQGSEVGIADEPRNGAPVNNSLARADSDEFGAVRLSADPVRAWDPIAVGDNDPRLELATPTTAGITMLGIAGGAVAFDSVGQPNGIGSLDVNGRILAAQMRTPNPRGRLQPNTTYNPWDLAIYRGKRILFGSVVTSNASAFVSASTYVALGPDSTYYMSDYGVIADGGNTDNAAAINAAIADVSAQGGGALVPPPGVIGHGSTIDVLSNVIILGQGHWTATQFRLLARSNCDGWKFHRSTGSGNSNAFFAGLMNVCLDGNIANQTAGDFHHGVNITTNPYNSTQTGDPDFDPKHILFNVFVRRWTGHGLYYSGRADFRAMGCFFQYNGGHGVYSSFDSHYETCVSGANGLSGFYFPNSAVQGTNLKSYNNGKLKRFVTGANYTAAQQVYYNGSVWAAKNAVNAATTAPDADATNWVQAQAASGGDLPWGYGYYVTSPGEFTLAGVSAEQNSASSFYVRGTKGSSIHGVSSDPTWDNEPGGTNAKRATNPENFCHLELDGAQGNNIMLGGVNAGQAYAMRLVNNATRNFIVITDDQTGAGTTSPDSAALVGSGNAVWRNGASLTNTLASLVDALISNPTDGQAVVFDGASGKWKNGAPGAASQFAAGFFGDGSDGAIVLDGVAAAPGMTRTGSVYRMTRDVFATSLTINNGVELQTNNWIVFGTGILTNNGTISNNGLAGQSNGTANAFAFGSLNGGTAGGAGGTGAGSAATNNSGAGASVGVGSPSGAGGSGSNGAGGAVAFATTGVTTGLRALARTVAGVFHAGSGPRTLQGGIGGPGGGGDGTNKGASGGSGAGIVMLVCRQIVNAGTITAIGGRGGDAAVGNTGGGTGGGGGLILPITQTSAWTNTGTTNVTGGGAGAGFGTGTAGAGASAGSVVPLVAP